MSKVAAILATLVIGSGVSVAGVYLSGLLNIDANLPETLGKENEEGFKKTNGGGCVQSTFKGIENVSDSGISEVSDNSISSSFLNTESDGCLVVNWNKDTKREGDKWKGTFRFLWAVKSQNKGFVVFTLGKTENSKISWEGIAYQVERDNDGTPWKIKGKKDVQSNKSFQSSETDEKKFPKPGTALNDAKDKNFWGFFEDKNKLANICSSSECTDSSELTKSSFRGYWTWEAKVGETQKLSDWTKELESWWKEIYGEDKWKMNDVVKDKTGSWKKALFELNG